MKYYECDNCDLQLAKPEVVLSGVVGTSEGVLLPEAFHEKHFCCVKCFWLWVDRFKPKELNKNEA